MKPHTILILVLTLGGFTLHALPPAALQTKLKSEKVTVIDVRSPSLYEKGHIPGAMNIPAAVCPAKKLPPLGDVVVYDAGLGQNEAESAALALNAKTGIKAQVLDGGFAAWQQFRGESTEAPGMITDHPPMITYAQVKAAQSNGVVLVDLRKQPRQSRQSAGQAPEPLSDLRKEFPGAAHARSAFDLPQTRQSGSGVPPLLVLVDSGDGSAQATAAALKANGITRFAILAGGEEIIARRGEAGLQRSGIGTVPPGLLKSTNPQP
jgi:rhodanese-related sulfurtransferase